jgi:alginate O-acetyltransferase complex protein AlgJ
MIDDVLIGQDGWLFLKGGSNYLISFYQEASKFNTHMIQSWHDLLKHRYDSFKKRGITYAHLFVPNKLSVYPEFAGVELKNFNGHPICALMNWLADTNLTGARWTECIVNPLTFYQEKKKNYLLYWKTDTHWTYWGCYWAYVLICRKIGIPPNEDLMHKDFGETEMVMDLGGKLTPPVKEKVKFYQIVKNSKRVYANKIVRYKEKNNLENDVGLHIGSHVIYKNYMAPNKEKVILFGDSFSEYRPLLLTGLLAETFKEVHYVWSTSIDFDYVWANKPHIVITEIVERFMPQVPSDKFSIEQYVSDKLRTTPPCFTQKTLNKLRIIKNFFH